MVTGLSSSEIGRLTKRELGEAYLLGTSIILAGILAGMLILQTRDLTPLFVIGFLPICGLIAVTYWLRQLSFDTTQVWHVATWGALGTGFVTACIIAVHTTAQILTISYPLTIALMAIIAASTISGALAGMVIEATRATQQLSVRNSVLHRVLRHNLRNDLTVVLAQIEDVKTSVNERQEEKLVTAEHKIHALVDLVDKIRQVNTSIEPKKSPPEPVDLVPLIEDRVTDLRETYPEVSLNTELPEQAWVHAETQFALVIDNVVESAIMDTSGHPTLKIAVTVDGGTVRLRIDDVGETIPDTDLSVLTMGTEKRLTHGKGVGLWLVAWLTERNNGSIAIDTDDGARCITISLTRAFPTAEDALERLLPV